MAWTDLLNHEADYLARVASELTALAPLAETSPALEQIYAAAHHAYALAHQELRSLEQDLAQMSHTATTLNAGWIPPALQQSLASLPPHRREVIQEMLTTFRFCTRRPSDVMRLEMRRQAGAILNGIQQLATQSSLSDADLARDVGVIGNLLCHFDTLPSEASTPPPASAPWYSSFLTWPGLLTLVGVGAAGWMGRGFLEGQGLLWGGGSDDETPLLSEGEGERESSTSPAEEEQRTERASA